MIKVEIYGSNKRITNYEEWFLYAPPKNGILHWKDYRSAKEHAKYMTSSNPYLPSELNEIISKYTSNNKCICYAEHVTNLEANNLGSGEGRNHDSLLVFDDLIVGIEAKAEETFGVECAKIKLDSNNQKARYNGISREIYGDDIINHKAIRYQLLSATIGTLIEAKNRNINKALLLVITYNSDKLSQINVDNNSNDLKVYIDSLSRDNHLYVKYASDNQIDFFIEQLKIELK